MRSNVEVSQDTKSNPVAIITLHRNIKVKNDPMPRLVKDRLYNAKNLPPQNTKNITVQLHCGPSKRDSIKVVVEPSYSFTGPYSQHIKGVTHTFYNGDVDIRVESIETECKRALTGIHELATPDDLAKLSKLVKTAVKKLDKVLGKF